MKAYLITTGIIFGLITAVHVARLVVEGAGPAKEAPFVLLTLLTAAMSVWAWRLLAKLSRANN
jgi:hypothetical protein